MAEAKSRKMKTTVHVGTDADARLAIEAGANGLEHAARGLSDATIAMMAAKKITFTPTNVVLDYAWKRRGRGGEDALARRLAIPAILQSLLDPNSPLAPFLRDGDDGGSHGAGVRRLARPDGAGHSRRACRSWPDRTPAIPSPSTACR